MLEKYADNIYRPGEEIDELEKLTEEQMTDRRREIESLFSDPSGILVSEGE